MKIVRKDGIEYERAKNKDVNYDKRVCIKLNSEQIEMAKEKSEELGISFAELVRRGIDLYINEN